MSTIYPGLKLWTEGRVNVSLLLSTIIFIQVDSQTSKDFQFHFRSRITISAVVIVKVFVSVSITAFMAIVAENFLELEEHSVQYKQYSILYIRPFYYRPLHSGELLC